MATDLSPAARLRALKRHVWPHRHRFLATCAVGVDELLADEVGRLPGVEAPERRTGGVAFTAPFDTLYTALLRLRVAESLRLYVAHDEAAGTYPMLHDHLTRIRWALWLPDEAEVTVRVKSTKSRLRDDAGLERALRRAIGAQGLDTAVAGAPPLILHLHLHHDRASLAFDLGGPLHRRRGAKWVTATTIRETTAAALCRWASADRGADGALGGADLVLDPFCGSGTLAIEALELAFGAPAGRDLAPPWVASPAWKPERFAHARRAVGAAADAWREARPPAPRVLASDADPDAVRTANRNLVAWDPDAGVRAEVARAQDLDLPALARRWGSARPLLLSNPPYGRSASALGDPPDALLRGLLHGARGWDFALLYPRPADLEGVDGVEVRQVRSLVTGGLRNAVVVGRVHDRQGATASNELPDEGLRS